MTATPRKPCHDTGFDWPDQPYHIALVEPEIPPNTGNIARLCAATDSVLHIVGTPGFRLTAAAVRRAGLDYWDLADVRRHASLGDLCAALPGHRLHLFTTGAHRTYVDIDYRPGDILVFGSETRGLPARVLETHADCTASIPMRNAGVRSLNLATSVGIVLYEALRRGSRRAPATH